MAEVFFARRKPPLLLIKLKCKLSFVWVVMQFGGGTRILRVIHGRDARATFSNCISAFVSLLALALVATGPAFRRSFHSMRPF